MIVTIILVVVAFVGGYFFGSNNPSSAIKAKIVADAQAAIKKI